ncbi:MAG: DUF1330 domain-containing protein [Pseudomonadota bacterium]
MSAFVVVHATVNDPDKMKEYGAAATKTIAEHHGEVVCRGPLEVLAGDTDRKLMVVIKFPSREAARSWYQSDGYQAVVPVRDAAAETTFTLVGDD